MSPEPSFESMGFNPFLANDSVNNSNQNPDVNFHNISSLETSYSFVPNCRWGGGSNKMHQGESYQDFLKWGGVVFGSFSYNN